MVRAHIYIEGGATGADSSEHKIRCRGNFARLLENCGFAGRLPRLTACGPRSDAFKAFQTALSRAKANDFVAMWIDSEDPIVDVEQTWTHLKQRDNWDRPPIATEEHVLFMSTCMETMIVADRSTMKSHFKTNLQESALPPLENLEQRNRHDVQDRLIRATRDCSNPYEKGKRSFEIIGKLNPDTLQELLPSFRRTRRILSKNL